MQNLMYRSSLWNNKKMWSFQRQMKLNGEKSYENANMKEL